MTVYYAPQKTKQNIGTRKMFLAGSIEMGKAIAWQDKLINDLKNIPIDIYNPRRTDWDSSWIQDPTPGTKFREQVDWELDHIEKSNIVVFFFDPATQSPITLLELGLCVSSRKKIIVCCPDGYFRKGNVVILCERYNITVLNSYDEFIQEIKKQIGY